MNLRLFSLVLLVNLSLAPSVGQAQASSPIFLPAGHWAYSELQGLHAAGLLRDPGARGSSPISIQEALRWLALAGPEAHAARAAFEAEFPQFSDSTAATLSGWIGLHASQEQGGIDAGYYERQPGWVWPALKSQTHEWGVAAQSAWTPLPRISLTMESFVSPSRLGVAEAYASTQAGLWDFWAGKRSVYAKPLTGGSIVVGEGNSFWGGGMRFASDSLPGFFSALGPVRVETSLQRTGTNGRVGRPLLWFFRGIASPFPALDLGVTRGALFGGDRIGNELRPEVIAAVLLGLHGGERSETENQIASVDATYRFSVASMPLVASLEWGFEDSAGAWWDVPAYGVGLSAPRLPMLPNIGLGIEHVSFSGSCCGNPPWYKHLEYNGGWTSDLQPLGHPLGGHGTEWLGWARLSAMNSRLAVESYLASRDRRRENLYWPAREGESRAFGVHAAAFWDPYWLDVELSRESGSGDWARTQASVGFGISF